MGNYENTSGINLTRKLAITNVYNRRANFLLLRRSKAHTVVQFHRKPFACSDSVNEP